MTLQLPPELLEVYELAGGGHWPQGDEDALRALADSHSAYGGAVASHHGDAMGSIDQALGSVEGKLQDSLSGIRGQLDHELREVSQAHESAAAALQQAANAVEHTKGMMLSSLAVLKSEIATARAMEPFTCGAARAAEAAAIASTKLTIATLAGALTGELAAAGTAGAATTIQTASLQSLLPSDMSAPASGGADMKAGTTVPGLAPAAQSAEQGTAAKNPAQPAAPATKNTARTGSPEGQHETAAAHSAPAASNTAASNTAAAATTTADTTAAANTAAPARLQGPSATDARAADPPAGTGGSASTGPGSVAHQGNNTGLAARGLLRTSATEKASREASAAHGARGATISADSDTAHSGFEQAAPNAKLADITPMAHDSALAEQAARHGPGTMGQNLSELVQQGQQGAQQMAQTIQQAVQQASQQNSMQAAQSMMSEAGDTERFGLGHGGESAAKAPHGGFPAGAAPQGAGAAHSLSEAPPSGSTAQSDSAASGRAGNAAVPSALRPTISQSGGVPMGAMGAGGAHQGQQQRSVPVPEYLRGSFDSEAPPIAVVDSVIGDLSPDERDEAEDLHTLAQQRASFGDEVQLDSAEWASEH